MRSCLARWVVVVAAWAALRVASVPALALPAPWQPHALVARLASDGAFVGTVALAHLLLTLVGGYVVILVTVGVAARAGAAVLPRGSGAEGLLRLLPHLGLPGTRALLAWSVGFAALGASALPTPALAATPPAPVMSLLSPHHPAHPRARLLLPPAPALLPQPAPTPPADRRPAPAPAPAPAAPLSPAPVPAAPAAASSPQPAPALPADPRPAPPLADIPPPPAAIPPTTTTPGTWVVQPGDHLWSISERTLAGAWGAAPAPTTLAEYWWAVVGANRATLPDPADIDLLFPGDVVSLPPMPARQSIGGSGPAQ